MSKKLKIFLAYFPITLIIGQLLCNVIWLFDKNYFGYGMYLNMVFGTNLAFALFMTGLTHALKFCYISQACAWAQVAYAMKYIIVPADDIWNVYFQIGVGAMALVVTINRYSDKFPLCKLGLLKRFFKSIAKEGSCTKGLERYHEENKTLIRQRNVLVRNKN